MDVATSAANPLRGTILRAATAAGAAALLSLGLAAGAPAQSVSGRVLAQPDGRPVEGAMIRLVGEGGVTVARTFSDDDGVFRLEAPAAGRYRLRAERIGLRTGETGWFRIGPGEHVERSVDLGSDAVPLEGITATSSSRCEVAPESGEETYRLWREARRALEAATWASDRGLLELRIRQFHRKLDPDFQVTETVSEETRTGMGVSPFTSLPPEKLADQGYVEKIGDRFLYYGPDADVLLSDVFQQNHCFWVTREDRPKPGWVGLAFQPVEGREVTDIEGVLWLEQATDELKRLVFRYVNLDLPTSFHEAGGRVDFFRLPEGPFIVRRWSLRMPRIAREQLRVEGYSRQDYELHHYEEQGGVADRIVTPEGRVLYDFERATVAGTVWDSLRSAPMDSVRVRLRGTELADVTDAQGRFRIPGVEEGSYVLEVADAASPFVGPVPRQVQATPGELTEARLATPGPTTLAGEMCPDADEGSAVVAGRVVRSDGGGPVQGGRVAASWASEAADGERAAAAEGGGDVDDAGEASPYVQREVRTDAEGRYRICGVPSGAEVAVRAAAQGSVTEPVRLSTARERVVTRELAVSPASEVERLAEQIRDQGLGAVAAGGEEGGAEAVIRGSVRSAGDDRPLQSAEILVGGETVAVTDSAGRFTVDGVPPGSHSVRVRYLGRGSQETSVRAAAGDTVKSTFVLRTDPVPLPELAVRVEGEEVAGKLAGFQRRKERGAGHFLTREEIEEAPGAGLAGALRSVPGIQVVPCRGGGGGCRTVRVQGSDARTMQTMTPRNEREEASGFGGLPDPEGGQGDGEGGGGGARSGLADQIPSTDTIPRSRRCTVAYYVDGAPMMNVASRLGGPAGNNTAGFTLDQIAKSDVQAVEVYTREAQTPARFSNNGPGCTSAVVVIWTRTGS